MGEKKNSAVLQTAGLLMIAMIASRVLGYFRDSIIYFKFGQNNLTDAYNAAFSIPDFLYMVLVGGALSAAFIPVFSSYIARDDEAEGWKIASIVINWVMLLLGICVFFGYIFTPQLVNILVPGFTEATKVLTVSLTRIMFIQVIFICLAGISTGILNSYRHFTSPALGSVLYNLGIIVVGLLFATPIEVMWPGHGIAGFSIGVVVGAIIYFAVQVPALYKVGMQYEFSLDWRHPGVKRLLALMLPILISLSASQINLFVNQYLASGLAEGMVAALRSGQRLMQVPISIFGISIAMAFFPTMTAYVAQGKMEEFKKSTFTGLRSVIFITVPAAVGIAILREPIIRLIFEFSGGAFTASNTTVTAQIVLFYSISIVAYAAIHVLARAFYSLQDTRTPVMAAVFSIVVNIVLNLYLVRIMQQNGLALAYSIAGLYNMVVLIILLRRKIGRIGLKALIKSFVQVTVASLAMAIVVVAFAAILGATIGVESKIGQILQVGIAIAAGAGVFGVITLAMKMEEADVVMDIFKRRLRRGKKTVEVEEE